MIKTYTVIDSIIIMRAVMAESISTWLLRLELVDFICTVTVSVMPGSMLVCYRVCAPF